MFKSLLNNIKTQKKVLIKEKKYPKVVEEIHQTFYTAGDKLLKEATEIINQNGPTSIDKAKRLEKLGFKNSLEVKKLESIKMTQDLANLIQYYQINYPNNKFITEEQVVSICKKYNLSCAPIERYKGFVPETKLQEIEGFKIKDKDQNQRMIKILSAWNTGAKADYFHRARGARHIHEQLGMELIPSDHPSLNWHGDNLFSVKGGYVERIRIYETKKMLICAPKKDLDLKGLKKIGAIFTSFTTITVPDPVVLQPCKGGYLIITAWGDEASDELVVNQNQN